MAIRPLFVEELAEVLAVDFSAAGRDSEAERRFALGGSRAGRTVSLFQFGCRYRGPGFAGGPIFTFHGQRVPDIGSPCLGILIRLGDHVDEESINTFPFARYAADSIADHVEFGDVLLHIQDEIDHLLDPDRPNFTAWLRLRGNLSRSQSRLPRSTPFVLLRRLWISWPGETSYNSHFEAPPRFKY